MLSFKSQRKLRPVELSNTASVGKLGKRHPDSTPERDSNGHYMRSNSKKNILFLLKKKGKKEQGKSIKLKDSLSTNQISDAPLY